VTRAYAPEAGIDRETKLDYRGPVPECVLVPNREQEVRGYLPAVEIGPVAETVPDMETDPAMGDRG
tara:strand:- start:45673 stop:45870 length:198 start_codon:yes stop_codon:yes gene_type:complete